MPGSEPQNIPIRPGGRIPRPEVQAAMGLHFEVAQNVEQVCEAWRLVYRSYLESSLIEPNPSGIHTAPTMASEHAAVITGCVGPVVASTLSTVIDSDQGLPLDRVYHKELQELRSQGRKLQEIGLFADRRRELARTAEALIELMRYVFYFGRYHSVTDYVIGVHPRHAKFYSRFFRFEAFGEERTYAAVRNRPVVLLRGDFAGKWEQCVHLYPTLGYFADTPVANEEFDRRFKFEPDQVKGTEIDLFLQEHWLRQQHERVA